MKLYGHEAGKGSGFGTEIIFSKEHREGYALACTIEAEEPGKKEEAKFWILKVESTPVKQMAIVGGDADAIAKFAKENGWTSVECPAAFRVELPDIGMRRIYYPLGIDEPFIAVGNQLVAILSKNHPPAPKKTVVKEAKDNGGHREYPNGVFIDKSIWIQQFAIPNGAKNIKCTYEVEE